jgi:hypothetical protein
MLTHRFFNLDYSLSPQRIQGHHDTPAAIVGQYRKRSNGRGAMPRPMISTRCKGNKNATLKRRYSGQPLHGQYKPEVHHSTSFKSMHSTL